MHQVLREGGIVNRDTQPFRQRTLLKDRRSQLIYLPEIKQPIKSEETLKGLEVSFFPIWFTYKFTAYINNTN